MRRRGRLWGARWMRGGIPATLVALSLGCATALPSASATGGPVTITDYTDPGQIVPWGQRSHWAQPWRSYLETVPAATLSDAVGINFNVTPKWANSTARLLANSGFKRARVEIGWGSIDYDDPSRLAEADRKSLETRLGALRDNGIRPLILLNANHGAPCPSKLLEVSVTSAANAGSRTVRLDPSSPDFDEIVPKLSGFADEGKMPGYLIAALASDGVATLAKPLRAALPAGALKVRTLLYEPFRAPTLEDGSPNPEFEPTMQGWLNYVKVVTDEVKEILGSDEFDVEVWNELSFGSGFLIINSYYEPDIEPQNDDNKQVILERTVEWLRDPANGMEGVGVGNGFSNTSPWWTGTNSPVGLTAIDKHPYAGWESFPRETVISGRPLNGLGEPAGHRELSTDPYEDDFAPTYESFFPERPLSAIHMETLVHDLGPTPSLIPNNHKGVAHGRFTHPEGGDPPGVWITEVNLDPAGGPVRGYEMTAEDIRHIETKSVLRYLTAYVNKGVAALDFYAANAGNLSLIDSDFFGAKANQTTYPGDALGGETTAAVRRLMDSIQDAEQISSPRSLSLDELTDFQSNVQFQGNGTAAYPPLYNRDVFAFLPFQVTQHRFVIPVYVMTRNVAKIYRPDTSMSDPTRFDMPAERYRMAIGGIDGENAQVSATDPLTGDSVSVEVISGSSDQVVVEMPVTDSPRLLTVQEDAAGEETPGEEAPEEETLGEETPGGSPEEAAEEEGGENQGPTARTDNSEDSVDAETNAGLRIHLRGGKALLKVRRLLLVARCESPCNVLVDGHLSIAGRQFRMRAKPRDSTASGQSDSTAVLLEISARAATLARRAIRRGSTVRVTVEVQPKSGGSGTARRILVLGR
jgi:hypothetical protein